MSGWHVERITGSADVLHDREIPSPLTRTIWIFTPERPAVVLGSTQSVEIVDPDAARSLGAEVVRRRSGGGAVWLEPGGTSWVDVLLPRDDPLWDDDVGRAVHWLGAAWAGAVGSPAVVHHGGMVCTALSGRVCFAGLGPGEVTADGRKVVGISQRRTRAGARFQCVAYGRWDARPLARVLGMDAEAAEALAESGAGLGKRLRAVEERLLKSLSSL